MNPQGEYVGKTKSIVRYLQLKKSNLSNSEIKHEYGLNDGDTVYFSSDPIQNDEEASFIKEILDMAPAAVYIYNEISDYDLSAIKDRSIFVPEESYMAFLLIPDFHIWFYDADYFTHLLSNRKLFFSSSFLEFIKNPPSESLLYLGELAFQSTPYDSLKYIYDCPNDLKSMEEIIGFYYRDCLTDEDINFLTGRSSYPINEEFVLRIINIAINNKMYIEKTTSSTTKHFRKVLNLDTNTTLEYDFKRIF